MCVCVCKYSFYLSFVTKIQKHSMWDQLDSLARCNACFLMNPRVQKENKCHSYYHWQLRAARCISQGDCAARGSEEAMEWGFVAKTGCETRF